MRITRETLRGRAALAAAAFTLLAVCLCGPAPAGAQWTQPDANNNINNTNAGKVGIGTTAPDSKLVVSGNAATPPAPQAGSVLHLVNADSAKTRLTIDSFGIGSEPSVTFRSARGTAASPSATQSGDPLGALYGTGYGATGFLSGQKPGMVMTATENWTDSAAGSSILFNTVKNGTTALLERLRINHDGNVGIGTANPTSKLHVVSGTDSGVSLLHLDTGVHGGTAMGVYGTTNNESGFDLSVFRAGAYSSRFGVTNTGHAYLQPNPNVWGRVGIGTTSPNYSLDVQGGSAQDGKVNASGGLCIAGDCKTAWSQVGGSSQWTTTGTSVYYSAGNVGVGTTSPGVKLQVNGTTVSGITAGTPGDYNGRSLMVTTRPLNDGVADIGFDSNSTYRGAFDFTGSTGNLQWYTNSGGGGSNTFTISGGGKVGIGTAAPLQKLQVGGNVTTGTMTPDAISLGATYSSAAGANPKLRLYDDNAGSVYGLGVSANQFDFMVPTSARYVWSVNGAEKMRLDENGNVTVSGSVAAKYQDVAEWVPSTQKLSAGTVVVLDNNRANHVLASKKSYDTGVAGVVSDSPGVILGEGGADKVKVATTGRVRVKVDATRAPIKVGDLLVTSGAEGLAMKSVPLDLGGTQIHRPGTIIGKALEPLEKGTGEILVLLSLQ